ncbi:MurR/RpiR family transcriptional regulator [Arthrobacter alkaliphilus]|uniref:MurR/RpiR family transcriptional regulator n=1 Tax=Arthrobacter alkaliphilus TaxID=369936 RepID=UPI001F2F1116|nr:MurR/RpiR family transcriptional regulator [Arthrobacter alkaliphilus]
MRAPDESERDTDSVATWLRSLSAGQRLSQAGQTVLNNAMARPEKASYITASELAQQSGTSISSVTRLAQRLGFNGWPDLQREIRVRYMAHLSLVDVDTAHETTDSPFQASLRWDLESLSASLLNADETQVERVVGLLSGAKNIYVTAQGSFAAVGHALNHNIQIAGYPARGLLDIPANIANTVVQMGPEDVLIVCSYWRIYGVAVTAATEAHARGSKVIVITDNLPPALAQCADEVLLVPAEGTSFFPSLTSAMALQQGIVASLARVDPEKTRRSLIEMENSWQTFQMLHRSAPGHRPDL